MQIICHSDHHLFAGVNCNLYFDFANDTSMHVYMCRCLLCYWQTITTTVFSAFPFGQLALLIQTPGDNNNKNNIVIDIGITKELCCWCSFFLVGMQTFICLSKFYFIFEFSALKPYLTNC